MAQQQTIKVRRRRGFISPSIWIFFLFPIERKKERKGYLIHTDPIWKYDPLRSRNGLWRNPPDGDDDRHLPFPLISNIYISSCYYIFSLSFYMKFSGTVFFFFQLLCVHTRAIQQSKKEEEEEGGGHHKTVNGLDTIKWTQCHLGSVSHSSSSSCRLVYDSQ